MSPGPAGDDAALLARALEQARTGRAEGGIPIGAVLAVDGVVLGEGRNRRVQLVSATRHGEIDALEAAGRLPAEVYRRATMVTTLSPCDMCTGAVLLYGIPRVVVGESETFLGGEDLLRSRGVEVVRAGTTPALSGLSAQCRALMQEFVAAEPRLWDEDIGEDH